MTCHLVPITRLPTYAIIENDYYDPDAQLKRLSHKFLSCLVFTLIYENPLSLDNDSKQQDVQRHFRFDNMWTLGHYLWVISPNTFLYCLYFSQFKNKDKKIVYISPNKSN